MVIIHGRSQSRNIHDKLEHLDFLMNDKYDISDGFCDECESQA